MRATFYVVNPTMVTGRRRFVFVVNAYDVRGGRFLTSRRFATIERATAFASRARTIRTPFPRTAIDGHAIEGR